MANDNERIDTEWLDIRAVTRYADVSVRTVRSWIHSPFAPLPAVRVAGKMLVRRSELDAWLERHRVKPLAVVDVDAIVREVLEGTRYGR
jgi:excisionase family DNA binding protein